MTTRNRITRRTILRGAISAIALPWLEVMGAPRCQGQATAPARRAAFLYVPNGVHMADWTPSRVGSTFAFPWILEPLRAYQSDLIVLSGLALDPARAHGDGGGDHARAMSAFLTGRHPRKTGGSDLSVGISIDQLMAFKIGGVTRFGSLELGCEGGRDSGQCDHGYSCAYQSNLSWRGPATPAAKETNPRRVFDRLFGRQGMNNSDAAKRERRDRSLLDFVADDTRRLSARLGTTDRRKLDEYLTGLREIEQRMARSERGNQNDPSMIEPAGSPVDYKEHIRLMADLIVAAFQADLTRVASLVFANDGSNRSYREIGITDGHHDLSHHGTDERSIEKIRAINRFHVDQFAYLIGRLKSIREGEETLLDQSMIVYGSGISDGNSHAHENLPILLAGQGGGTIETGRHLRYPRETPLTNLYLSMLDRMGFDQPSFGDSTGKFTDLDV